MTKSRAKSAFWSSRQSRDPYVKEAKRKGYRSRASFKLVEIDRQHRLIKPDMTVVELGSAPGGWSQVLIERLRDKGKLVAIDILPMNPIKGVSFIQGDFTDLTSQQQLVELLQNDTHPNGQFAGVDLVLSDMAPNLTGIDDVDQARMDELAHQSVSFACQHLKSGGSCLLKLFQGSTVPPFVNHLKQFFKAVSIVKPAASRACSKEVYVLAQSFKSH